MNGISKIVFTLEGKRFGYVLDVAISDWKNVGYYVVDDETEGEFFLHKEDILQESKDFVLIENEGKMEISLSRENFRGKQILDEFANDYGRVSGFVFSKNVCTKIVTEKCEILTKYIKIIGKDALFVFNKKRKNVKNKQTFPKTTQNIKVEIMEKKKVTVPEKITLSSSFYVGKICVADVFGYNNERIVSKGEKITKSIFEKAKKHNKLNQLFFLIER